MTPIIPVIAVVAILLSGTTHRPVESVDNGTRLESESYTGPKEISRCIAYNIAKKMPDLRVRQYSEGSPDERGYLIVTTTEASPTTFGVIRVDRRAEGTHLTTWLPHRSASAASEGIAQRLVAGC